MNRPFSLNVFTAVFAVVYLCAVVLGWTEFRFYPLTGALTTQDLPRSNGPAMGWYAWITQGFFSGLVAAAVSMIVPKHIGDKVWSGVLWAVPAALVAVTFFIEWHWFAD